MVSACASLPLPPRVGSSEEELSKLVRAGESAIVEEIKNNSSPTARDASGYTDAEWLQYIKDEVAEERLMPQGMPDTVLDRGHTAMTLDDFAKHASAVGAGLKRAHVLALRLYTSGMHATINGRLQVFTRALTTRPLHKALNTST